MSTSPERERVRTRAQRVAARVSYDGLSEKIQRLFWNNDGAVKLALVAATAAAICAICAVWNPPFSYRLYAKPERDVVSRAEFSVLSAEKTNEARQNARLETPHVYSSDASKLAHYKTQFLNEIQGLIAHPNFETLPPEERVALRAFLPPNATEEDEKKAFDTLQDALEKDLDLANFKASIDRVFKPFETTGILLKLHRAREGNQETIGVYDVGDPQKTTRPTPVRDVLIGNAYLVKDLLNREYYDRAFSDLLFQKIRSTIPETLTEDRDATTAAQNAAEEEIGPVYTKYDRGQTLVRGGVTIGPPELELLYREHLARLGTLTFDEKFRRTFAVFTLLSLMLVGALALFYNRLLSTTDEGGVRARSSAQHAGVFGMMLATILIGRALQLFLASRGGSTELIPLLIFVQLTAFAASWGAALTFGTIVAFAFALCGGYDLGAFAVFVGTSAIVALASRNIRTRSQLIGVALAAGVVAFLLSWSAETSSPGSVRTRVFREASLHGLWAILAGFLTSALLPFVERACGVLTPMRLLEFGNPSHPLLLELNRRAPATYSHSIQTAAIAEAAAEAIGARAALVRVGAYFHDVGKMLQPEHFTENQRGYNIHDELEPRMSALVIVAHVKDGVDLGKRYRLPRQIVDFIEQHHGTMLAGFFYQKANQAARESDLPAGQNLDEGPFRYPGPIPQTKEAGILMLADAAESASRSLGDAAPGKIENLVRQITDARIEDGQLNDSGLTLGEIRTVEKSLVTSILASRHSRVKYPSAKLSGKDAAKDGATKPNFGVASAEVAPTDEYEFVRLPGPAATEAPNVVVTTSAKSTQKTNDKAQKSNSSKKSGGAKGGDGKTRPVPKKFRGKKNR